MPDKNLKTAQKNGVAPSEATNLWLNSVAKSRGLKLARGLGFNLSTLVEDFLLRLHEAHVKKPRRQPGDYLQIEIFDRLPEKPTHPNNGYAKNGTKKK